MLPGFSYTSVAPLFVAAAATGLVGMIVRPVLVELAAAIGWIAVALATLFGQALVMQLALSVVPGSSSTRSGRRSPRPGSRPPSAPSSPG